MPLHSAPYFVNTEAIRADKIDEVIQGFAAKLNGGLDATSLAAGVTFALSQFWEGYSVCPVYLGDGFGARESSGAVIPVTGYVIGVAGALQEQSPVGRQLRISVNNVVAYSSPAQRGDSLKGRRAFQMLETPISVVAGDYVTVGVEDIAQPGTDIHDSRATVLLAFPHQ